MFMLPFHQAAFEKRNRDVNGFSDIGCVDCERRPLAYFVQS